MLYIHSVKCTCTDQCTMVSTVLSSCMYGQTARNSQLETVIMNIPFQIYVGIHCSSQNYSSRFLLFRYFTLFMNLLNDCSEEATEEKCGAERQGKRPSSNLSALRNCTVLAMSNLLNANIDSGLMHSIGKFEVSSR